ncbi:MAG: glycosyltransferase [Lachnospiraceae bacterium]|nr:glycosyltransferase [Lachnospiraceae bacterium]
MNIKVSVIVPIYNQKLYLHDCLKSLTSQTMKEIEFIIIDNGSEDCSYEIMKEYAAQDSRFKLIQIKMNKGVAKAINLGIRLSKGIYVAELDSDDYVAANMYEEMYQIAEENNLDILKSNLWDFSTIGGQIEKSECKIASLGFYNRVVNPQEEKKVFDFPVYAWTALYHRKMLLDNHCFWNEGDSTYTDNGFFWQTMVSAKRVMYLDVPYVYHRRDNEQSTVKSRERMFTDFFKEHTFIEKFLKESGYFESVKRAFYQRKLFNYFFALHMIPYERKLDFFRLVSQDFKKDIEIDGLNDCDFDDRKVKQRINDIYNNPEQYYYQTYLPDFCKVSVVIPVHNAEKSIGTTLDDVLNQSLKEIEIILVENGSTDSTMEAINEYARKDARIQVISIGASNAGAARNIGLQHAHGTYVIFLDADDRFHPHMLRKAFLRGRKMSAEVIWFKSERKDYLTGHRTIIPYAFREEQIPQKDIFSFSEISGNPFKAFNGWAWDKLFLCSYIKNNSFCFQEQIISNDGFFTYLAMVNARRITTINEVLVTQIMGHGENISTTKHDANVFCGYDMRLAIRRGLEKFRESRVFIKDFDIQTVEYITWLFFTGLKTDEGKEKLFNYLVSGGLQKLVDLDEGIRESKEIGYLAAWCVFSINKYKVGEFKRFSQEVLNKYFEYMHHYEMPNTKIVQTESRLIFGQEEEQGKNTLAGLTTIWLEPKDTSNISVVIDFLYMGNYTAVVKDVLKLSISLQGQEGKLQGLVHQAEWDKGEAIFRNHIYYTFTDNAFTIYAKYTEKYTGFAYKIRNISTREGYLTYSITANNRGYMKQIFPTLTGQHVQITAVQSKGGGGGCQRVIFRIEEEMIKGLDLFSVELLKYDFNNIVMAIDIVGVPNNQPAIFDTLYLGFMLDLEAEPTIKVFQAEWQYARAELIYGIYYYTRGNCLFVGAVYNGQWSGYSYEIKHTVGREYNEDWIIRHLSKERVVDGLMDIPDSAVFIENKTNKD